MLMNKPKCMTEFVQDHASVFLFFKIVCEPTKIHRGLMLWHPRCISTDVGPTSWFVEAHADMCLMALQRCFELETTMVTPFIRYAQDLGRSRSCPIKEVYTQYLLILRPEFPG